MHVKSLNKPDELRTPPKAKLEVVNVGDTVFMRGTFEPGWKWSECVKPIVGTESCQVSHIMYVISGKMMVRMDDGTEMEINAGDAVDIPPGHDAWVVGNEPCVSIDFTGGKTYAK